MESINQRLSTATNDWAKALYLIINDYHAGTNMIKVLKQSPFFWKFQSRVSDLSKWHPDFKNKLQKIPVKFKDKITEKEGYYFQYTFIGSKAYLINLYNKINKQGLYRSHKPKK